MMHRLTPLKQEIKNGVRMLLPDPQVPLTLLSSPSNQSTIQELGLKRKGSFQKFLLCIEEMIERNRKQMF